MSAKTHNRPSAVDAKSELRSRVLARVKPARVLDAFCGPDGEMFDRVWHGASSYTGIDEKWSLKDERRRFVGDNMRVLRAIDLSAFNVFDLDAFGSPWAQAIVIADRRAWKRGERGAIVITDGTTIRMRMGGIPSPMAELLSIRTHSGMAPGGNKESLVRTTLRAWAKRARVECIAEWQAVSGKGAVGNVPMIYMGMVFEGTGAPARNA